MRSVLAFAIGCAISATGFYALSSRPINIPVLLTRSSETITFCNSTSVDLSIGGSRLNPNITIGCPDSPCSGVTISDGKGNIVSAIVPGVPANFECGDQAPKVRVKNKQD